MQTQCSDLQWLDETQLPDSATIGDFQRDGHVTVRGLADAEQVSQQREAIREAAKASDLAVPPLNDRDTYGKAFLKYMNLWADHPVAQPYVLARRYAAFAAALLGVDGVRIYHDQALFKEPGGGPTPWHQDQYYWPVDTDATVTMWMPLVDLDESMGILKFASHSHRDGYLGSLPISDESDRRFNEFVTERGFSINQPQSMRAGDATFHRGWTLHSAPANSSDRMREVLTIIWVADGCRVTEPVNPNQARDIERWMPGLTPGDKVASELNPLVYSQAEAGS